MCRWNASLESVCVYRKQTGGLNVLRENTNVICPLPSYNVAEQDQQTDQHQRSFSPLFSQHHNSLWLGLIGSAQDIAETQCQAFPAGLLSMLKLGLNLNPWIFHTPQHCANDALYNRKDKSLWTFLYKFEQKVAYESYEIWMESILPG